MATQVITLHILYIKHIFRGLTSKTQNVTYVQCGRQYYSGNFNFKIFQLLFCSLKDDIIESTMQKVQAQGRGTKNINRSKEMKDKKNQAIRKFLNMALPYCESTCKWRLKKQDC